MQFGVCNQQKFTKQFLCSTFFWIGISGISENFTHKNPQFYPFSEFHSLRFSRPKSWPVSPPQPTWGVSTGFSGSGSNPQPPTGSPPWRWWLCTRCLWVHQRPGSQKAGKTSGIGDWCFRMPHQKCRIKRVEKLVSHIFLGGWISWISKKYHEYQRTLLQVFCFPQVKSYVA